MLLSEVALVLSLKVNAPLDGILKLLTSLYCLLQNLNGLRIRNTRELGSSNVVKALKQTLIHKLVKHLKLIWAVLKNIRNNVAEHLFCNIHVLCKITESHLWLNHPELCSVAACVGVLCAERWTKGVHITKGHSKVLCLKLTRNGEVRRLTKEIL